jgi:hypothetical protein
VGTEVRYPTQNQKIDTAKSLREILRDLPFLRKTLIHPGPAGKERSIPSRNFTVDKSIV